MARSLHGGRWREWPKANSENGARGREWPMANGLNDGREDEWPMANSENGGRGAEWPMAQSVNVDFFTDFPPFVAFCRHGRGRTCRSAPSVAVGRDFPPSGSFQRRGSEFSAVCGVPDVGDRNLRPFGASRCRRNGVFDDPAGEKVPRVFAFDHHFDQMREIERRPTANLASE
jgi:hypothetical protein